MGIKKIAWGLVSVKKVAFELYVEGFVGLAHGEVNGKSSPGTAVGWVKGRLGSELLELSY